MKRREEGTEGKKAVGRNRVKISSKVSGGQMEEEKETGESAAWRRLQLGQRSNKTRLC